MAPLSLISMEQKFLAMYSLRCEKQVKCEISGSFAYRSQRCIILPHMAPLPLKYMERSQ